MTDKSREIILKCLEDRKEMCEVSKHMMLMNDDKENFKRYGLEIDGLKRAIKEVEIL